MWFLTCLTDLYPISSLPFSPDPDRDCLHPEEGLFQGRMERIWWGSDKHDSSNRHCRGHFPLYQTCSWWVWEGSFSVMLLKTWKYQALTTTSLYSRRSVTWLNALLGFMSEQIWIYNSTFLFFCLDLSVPLELLVTLRKDHRPPVQGRVLCDLLSSKRDRL